MEWCQEAFLLKESTGGSKAWSAAGLPDNFCEGPVGQLFGENLCISGAEAQEKNLLSYVLCAPESVN